MLQSGISRKSHHSPAKKMKDKTPKTVDKSWMTWTLTYWYSEFQKEKASPFEIPVLLFTQRCPMSAWLLNIKKKIINFSENNYQWGKDRAINTPVNPNLLDIVTETVHNYIDHFPLSSSFICLNKQMWEKTVIVVVKEGQKGTKWSNNCPSLSLSVSWQCAFHSLRSILFLHC